MTKNSPVVDFNGYIHNAVDFYVVDADGKLVSSGRRMPYPRPSIPNLKKVVTVKDLERLDDAIFEHGEPFRQDFLSLIEHGIEIDTYFSRRSQALYHCWSVLKWRPDSHHPGRVWKKKSINPYTKDK